MSTINSETNLYNNSTEDDVDSKLKSDCLSRTVTMTWLLSQDCLLSGWFGGKNEGEDSVVEIK